MSDHRTYEEIKREQKSNSRPKPISPAWEAMRERFSKGEPSPDRVACVCSHSKYHHNMEKVQTVRGEEWWFGKCIHHGECGCEFYDEHVWKGGVET